MHTPHQFGGLPSVYDKAVEPDVAAYIHSFHHHLEAVMAKNGGYIVLMDPQHITPQQSALFRATKSFNKR
jgi:hypothetical protein